MKAKCQNAREVFWKKGVYIKINNTHGCHNPHSALTSWRTFRAKWSCPGSSYFKNLVSIFCLHVISLRDSSIVVITRLNLKLTKLWSWNEFLKIRENSLRSEEFESGAYEDDKSWILPKSKWKSLVDSVQGLGSINLQTWNPKTRHITKSTVSFSHCNCSLNFIIRRTWLSHYYCPGIPVKIVLLAVCGQLSFISLAGGISCWHTSQVKAWHVYKSSNGENSQSFFTRMPCL